MLRYRMRHRKHEDWEDLSTPGCWSRWYLWEKPSKREAQRSMEKHFGIKISRKRSSSCGTRKPSPSLRRSRERKLTWGQKQPSCRR